MVKVGKNLSNVW